MSDDQRVSDPNDMWHTRYCPNCDQSPCRCLTSLAESARKHPSARNQRDSTVSSAPITHPDPVSSLRTQHSANHQVTPTTTNRNPQ